MSKIFILMGILFLFSSEAANAGGRRVVNPDPVTPPVETPTIPTPVGDHPGVLKVKIEKLVNFEAADVTRLQGGIEVFERVSNSAEFKDRVLNHTYDGVKQFVQNNGLSNEQVYYTLLAGQETFNKVADSEANLTLELYYSPKNVVGYTYPNTNQIFMNTKYFRSFKAADIAGNMIHEWCHKIGFDHDYNATARRPYSVPYAIGYLMDDLNAKVKKVIQ